jgi:hypothetical protein
MDFIRRYIIQPLAQPPSTRSSLSAQVRFLLAQFGLVLTIMLLAAPAAATLSICATVIGASHAV